MMNFSLRLIKAAVAALPFSFLSGLVFLFGLIIPFEEFLSRRFTAQQTINLYMAALILIWLSFSYFYWLLCFRRFAKPAFLQKPLMIFTILIYGISAISFYFLLTTENDFILRFRGKETEELGERVTFGPYPDKQRLAQLKKDGYSGVVSLLSNTIPFEKVLLEKEARDCKELGFKFYSYPMLPWLSGNEDALQKILLIFNQSSGKYYIHCYLGRHRINLVKKTLRENKIIGGLDHALLYGGSFERGELKTFNDGMIFAGPYPTPEEWFDIILRSEVKEVITLLKDTDTAPGWLKEEEDICRSMGLRLVKIKVPASFSNDDIKRIADYVLSRKERVFVHSFLVDSKLEALIDYLRFGSLSVPVILPGYKNYRNLIYFSKNKIQDNPISSYGFGNDTSSNAAAYAETVCRHLKEKTGTRLYYGFTDEALIDQTINILSLRLNGLKNTDLLPPQLSGKIISINNRLFISVLPDLKELSELLSYGFADFVYIQGRNPLNQSKLRNIESYCRELGLEFVAVNFNESYLKEVAYESLEDNTITLVMTSREGLVQLENDLNAQLIGNL